MTRGRSTGGDSQAHSQSEERGRAPTMRQSPEPRRPIGGGGAGHPNSLANLQPRPENLEPGAGAWKPGATPNLKHGLRTRQPAAEAIDPVLDQVIADLQPAVPEPLRDGAGGIAAWAKESVWTLGILKLGIVRCLRFLAQNGETDGRGRWRPENEALGKATERYRRALRDEAMTLRSRLEAGLDIARTADISVALSERDPERKAKLMTEVGLPPERESS